MRAEARHQAGTRLASADVMRDGHDASSLAAMIRTDVSPVVSPHDWQGFDAA